MIDFIKEHYPEIYAKIIKKFPDAIDGLFTRSQMLEFARYSGGYDDYAVWYDTYEQSFEKWINMPRGQTKYAAVLDDHSICTRKIQKPPKKGKLSRAEIKKVVAKAAKK